MKARFNLLGLTATFAVGTATTSEAVLLSEIDFSGGSIGQSLADNASINGVGMVANFDGFTSQANTEYVAALSGSLGSSGNALSVGVGGSSRFRAIIDRTTTAWLNSGLLDNPGNPDSLIGAQGGTLYGSVLINNPSAPTGFTGLEFAAGDPNSNRVITLGETDNVTDFVVLGSGVAGGVSDLALPAIVLGQTREIVFRIDYGASNVDTFTLINNDGTDGASGTGNFTFSTLHIASFTGSPAIIYDDIRLGTTLADVSGIPEPSSLALLGLGGLLVARRRRA